VGEDPETEWRFNKNPLLSKEKAKKVTGSNDIIRSKKKTLGSQDMIIIVLIEIMSIPRGK
jgi:hypothetical protein